MELIDTSHTRIRALAAELDIGLDGLHTLEESSFASDVWYCGDARRSLKEIPRALVSIAERLEAGRRGWGEDFDSTYGETLCAKPLGRMTVAEWLDPAETRGRIR